MNEEKQITPLCDEEYCFLPIIYNTNEMCKYCIRRTKEYEVEE